MSWGIVNQSKKNDKNKNKNGNEYQNFSNKKRGVFPTNSTPIKAIYFMHKNNTFQANNDFAAQRISERRNQDSKAIIKAIEKGTGKRLRRLKKKYSEDKLFYIGLKHVTTTKKAYCEAIGIPIEAGCRYKRNLEKLGLLVQSIDEVYCPYTAHKAHEISTNRDEFPRLLKSDSNQLNMFGDE